MTDSNIRRLTKQEEADLLIRQRLLENALVDKIDELYDIIAKLEYRIDKLEMEVIYD